MLMMPPALATKSGAHRIPRSVRRSAISSDASWLFAAPAIARQRSAGTDSASSTPPRAHGALRPDRGGGIGPLRAELVGQRAPALVDVRHDEPRPGGGKATGERPADPPEADDGDRARVELGRAPDALARDP